MKAALIVAMKKELELLTNAGYQNTVLSGIGKVNAARATTEIILKSNPDCIVNFGVAGGLGEGMKVSDLVIATEFGYHDVWCGEGNEPGQVQGLPRFFSCSPELVQKAQNSFPQAKSGLVVTGDQFLTSVVDERRILEIFPQALACDMEGSAIAQVCHHYNVPFLSLRLISDVHTSEEADEKCYDDFWETVPYKSFEIISKIL